MTMMKSEESLSLLEKQNTHFARGTCSILIVLKMEERAVFIMIFLKREEILGSSGHTMYICIR